MFTYKQYRLSSPKGYGVVFEVRSLETAIMESTPGTETSSVIYFHKYLFFCVVARSNYSISLYIRESSLMCSFPRVGTEVKNIGWAQRNSSVTAKPYQNSALVIIRDMT